MSLINDALKRANEQKAKQASSAEVGSGLQTVEPIEQETKLWPIALFIVLVSGSIGLGWSWWNGSISANSAGSDAIDVAARTTPPSETPKPAVVQVPASSVPTSPAATLASPLPVAQPTLPIVSTAPLAPATPPMPAIVSPQWVAREREPIANPNPTSAPRTAPAANPPTPVEPAGFPKLVLQGVYYRPSRPSVVINSKTLYVGDKISQAKILAIDRREVTVQWGNEVRVLAIE